MMKVVLAEKPSVAREIAQFLRAGSRQDGYFEGNGYQVTWAYGHLVTLKEPDEYDTAWKKWSLDTLPILPERFELKTVDDKLSRKQFAVVKQLFRSADEIICATDAGREGELIFRYIQTLTGCASKPFSRLWLSSLTTKAIREAFDKLRPGREYDRLYAAARCRSEADWIVGMNGTRNFTVRFGGQGMLWSVGRVQTPVLAMIVRRDDEIRTFRPEPFWELLTRYRETQFKFAGNRFAEEAEAQRTLDRVLGQPFAVTKIDKRRERSQPPQLYDLTELQRDMNRRFGLSANATLQAAQALYEAKLITYPRTDSRYLTRDMQREVPQILEQLRSLRPDEIGRLDLAALPCTGRIVNDSKVGDHHAILPTGKLPGGLAGPQARVYEAVVTRLIAAFYPPCEKEVTTVDGQSAAVPFRAKGYRVLDPGWTILYPRKAKKQDAEKDGEDEEDSQELPAFTMGETGPHEPSIRRGETAPPKAYTENTLLGAMETAGRLVEEEALREALKEKGLGTPATRAAIIETLLKRDYIRREKKNLIATDLGRYLIAVVGDQDLKSPELTGQWEAKLRQIEAGRLDSRQFMNEIAQYTRRILAGSATEAVDEQRLGECPRCGRPVVKGKQAYGCSGWRDGCPFVLQPTWQDQPLRLEEIRGLLQHRALLAPRPSREGGDVILALTDTGHVTEIPLPHREERRSGKTKAPRRGKSWGTRKPPSDSAGRATGTKRATRTRAKPAADSTDETNAKDDAPDAAAQKLGACPLCGGEVVEQKKSFSCSHWRDGCRFVIWKTIAGKRITARLAQSLLENGQTDVLKGFKSKAGKPFEARLKLVDGEVKFEFPDRS
jgi:DNA topoisomerase III